MIVANIGLVYSKEINNDKIQGKPTRDESKRLIKHWDIVQSRIRESVFISFSEILTQLAGKECINKNIISLEQYGFPNVHTTESHTIGLPEIILPPKSNAKCGRLATMREK